MRRHDVPLERESEEHICELDESSRFLDLELLRDGPGAVGGVVLAEGAEGRGHLCDELRQHAFRELVVGLRIELSPCFHETVNVGGRDEVGVL